MPCINQKTNSKHNPKTKTNALDLFLGYAVSCFLFLPEIMSKVVNIKKIPSTQHGYIWFLDYIVKSGKERDK